MIVRDRPNGLRLFLTMRGSVLPSIWKSLAITTLLAVVVTWSHGQLWHTKIQLTIIPFTLMGLPLAIFLGFRNNSAYDRFWEGRKLWGELVLRNRNFARQCLSLIDDDPSTSTADHLRTRMIRRAIAFSHALRHQLRRSDAAADVGAHLQPIEWAALQGRVNLSQALMLEMGADLARCRKAGLVDSVRATALDNTMCAMVATAASCERIKNTPIPFSYTLLLHRTAYLYCFLLPFGLVDAIGFMTPLVVAIVAYTFYGLDALGDEIEEPFGLSPNDLPLDAICRAIEIDLRDALGETDLPPPLLPVNYWLR
ncbi:MULTISPECIES: bestrophin family protein [unclassified Massilia]|uniref:bestrophin family protein n=1 Tax=unclassified Massilia TaxID=2609279 RepID=UPI001786548C|nr:MULTISPECIES: bestrophin family protein [unclassified Massilia]MBD8529617.1 bestrophin family protein [Massilia sp. CFBP 13647]MBD8673296.1 bestrophin family protein [Massilia sp. CFBP 13721]